MHLSKPLLGLGLLAAVPLSAAAATYNVGPGRQYTQLTTFFNSVNLAPGDIVEVDGNATYAGNIVVGDDDSGTQASPVTIRHMQVISMATTSPISRCIATALQAAIRPSPASVSRATAACA